MKQIQIVANEEGSTILIGMMILLLLTIIGLSAMDSTNMEIQISQSDRAYKRNFYFAEGGSEEVVFDVNKAGSSINQNNERASDDFTYMVLDIDTPVLLTATKHGDVSPGKPALTVDKGTSSIATAPEVTLTDPDNLADPSWPVNHIGGDNEYAFRVYYREAGGLPKGYDSSKFGAYIFDITIRKQQTNANNAVKMHNVINRGLKKIGPKNADM